MKIRSSTHSYPQLLFTDTPLLSANSPQSYPQAVLRLLNAALTVGSDEMSVVRGSLDATAKHFAVARHPGLDQSVCRVSNQRTEGGHRVDCRHRG